MNDYQQGFKDASVLCFQLMADTMFEDFREETQITASPEPPRASVGLDTIPEKKWKGA